MLKGLGLISILITALIIAYLAFNASGGTAGHQNQVETGQEAIDQAQKAADKENQRMQSTEIDIQNQLNSH